MLVCNYIWQLVSTPSKLNPSKHIAIIASKQSQSIKDNFCIPVYVTLKRFVNLLYQLILMANTITQWLLWPEEMFKSAASSLLTSIFSVQRLFILGIKIDNAHIYFCTSK